MIIILENLSIDYRHRYLSYTGGMYNSIKQFYWAQMHITSYDYSKTDPAQSKYSTDDYTSRKKNTSYMDKKYEAPQTSSRYGKYRDYDYDREDYYSPKQKKIHNHPLDLRNSVNVLPNYEYELERAKARNKKFAAEHNTNRDRSPNYDLKKDYSGYTPGSYNKSPSHARDSKYDLTMSSVSAYAARDYNSTKNKYLEETTPEHLTKSNVTSYISRTYDSKSPIRDVDKKVLKEKYKSYFSPTAPSKTSGSTKEPIDKSYSDNADLGMRKQLEYKEYSTKPVRDEYPRYQPSKEYETSNSKADYRSSKYQPSSYEEAPCDRPQKRFAKKKYDQTGSPSSTNQDLTLLLAKSRISKVSSKSKLQQQEKSDSRIRGPSLMVKEIPNIPNKVEFNIGIKDFKLGKTKGEGKFGVVYIATHTMSDSLYAIKKIPKQIIKSHMLQNQLALQIKLQSYLNHPNILRLYGFFDDKENIYLVLEYMEQGTLFEFLRKRTNKLTEKEVALKIREISSAIKYLHDLDIAHRDIKPENIVLSNGVAKLCDFGWATRCTDRRKTYCGTFDYAAPEILEGKEYDWCVDLWCLGVLTFELLTGKVPFYHISRKQTMKKILRVDRDQIVFPPEISWKAKDFVESLIKKDPHQRRRADQLLTHPFLAQIKEPVLL